LGSEVTVQVVAFVKSPLPRPNSFVMSISRQVPEEQKLNYNKTLVKSTRTELKRNT